LRYDSGKKRFITVSTKAFGATIDAIVLDNIAYKQRMKKAAK